MKLSIVIPCFYSGKSLRKVVNDILCRLSEQTVDEYEMILVNDGSSDDTYEIIKGLAMEYQNITGINLAKNEGQHNAIMAGFHYITGDYVMVCSDDGQSPIESVGQMIEGLNQQYDVVCAKYMQRNSRNLFRELGTSINSFFSSWLIEQPKGISFSVDFMAKRFVIDEILNYKGPYCYIGGLIYRTTQNVGNIEAVQHHRGTGQSGYTLNKLIKLCLNGFTAFSVKPLRVSAFVGVFFAFSGFILAVVVLIRKLLNMSVQIGWSSVIIIMLISFGLIMIMLGMIGEYIGRIYMCINSSPQYVIKESVNVKIMEENDR